MGYVPDEPSLVTPTWPYPATSPTLELGAVTPQTMVTSRGCWMGFVKFATNSSPILMTAGMVRSETLASATGKRQMTVERMAEMRILGVVKLCRGKTRDSL